jgi:acyl-CoA synthetase (AMP-forming)/AMP-acid ligase II
MNVFVFKTYLEYVSPADGTVMRHVLKDIGEFAEHNLLYQFTYDDLSPQQREIVGMSEDPVAVRVANRLPARTTEELRAMMVVTPAQIRLALLQVGITPSQITATIAQIPDEVQRETASILWEYATQFERNHPFVTQIGLVLGKTDEEIDQIFAVAKTLN